MIKSADGTGRGVLMKNQSIQPGATLIFLQLSGRGCRFNTYAIGAITRAKLVTGDGLTNRSTALCRFAVHITFD